VSATRNSYFVGARPPEAGEIAKIHHFRHEIYCMAAQVRCEMNESPVCVCGRSASVADSDSDSDSLTGAGQHSVLS